MTNRLTEGLLATMALMRPDQTFPQFGNGKAYKDTTDELMQFLKRVSIAFQLLEKPLEGLQKLKAIQSKNVSLYLFEDAGYAAFRYNRKTEPSSSQHVFIDFSPQIHSHGHFDTGSFTYWSEGLEWIIDSGGPFKFDNYPIRTYLRSSRAHNVCAPQGFSQRAGISNIESVDSKQGTIDLTISSIVYGPDAKYRSTYELMDNGEFRLKYKFSVSKSRPVECRLHLHPEVKIIDNIDPGHIILSRGNRSVVLQFNTISGNRPKVEIIRQKGTSFDGYISRSDGELQTTSVIVLIFPRSEFPAEFRLRPGDSLK